MTAATTVYKRWSNHSHGPMRVNIFGHGGFTLIDLMIVILILGMAGMAVIPRFASAVSLSRLNAATSEMVAALHYAGALAVLYQRPFGVQADSNGNWFRVCDQRFKSDADPHADAVPPVAATGIVFDPVRKSAYAIDFDLNNDYAGVRITSVPAGGEIVFYPDGHCAASDLSLTVKSADTQRTLYVQGATGRVTVQ